MDNVLNLLKDRPCDYCVNHQHGYCTVWECPFDGAVVHEKQNEGHYEYGIFDGEGNLVGNIWDDGEFVQILCEERNARSVKKGYCVKLIKGELTNIKLTYPEDVYFAQSILRSST